MAGVVGRVQMRNGIYAWFKEIEGQMLGNVQEAALKATISAEDVMRQRMDTTPSDLSRNPKGNRNWTYHMRNRIDSKVTRQGNTLRLQVGWFNVKSDENYFEIQEEGGNVQGKQVTAMGALTSAHQEMLRVLKNESVL